MNIRLSDVSGVPNPAELTKKDDYIFIDLMPFAYIVRSCLSDNTLVAPEKGLYLGHSVVPFLRMDQAFITKNIPHPITLNDVADISTINENIYDTNGNLIIGFGPGFPQVYFGCPNPVIELKVVQWFLESEIYDRLNWNPRIKQMSLKDYIDLDVFAYENPNGRVVYDYEAVEGFVQDVKDKLSECLDGLALQVSSFLNDHTWNMYDISYSNSIACIRRGIDYRVYEWTRIHHEHEQDKLRISRGD